MATQRDLSKRDRRQVNTASGAGRWTCVVVAASLLLAATLNGCGATGDSAPRFLQVTKLGDTFSEDKAYAVWATVRGQPEIAHVRLYWTRSTETDFHPIAMKALADGAYHGSIPAQPRGTRILYFVWASDPNGETSKWPAAGIGEQRAGPVVEPSELQQVLIQYAGMGVATQSVWKTRFCLGTDGQHLTLYWMRSVSTPTISFPARLVEHPRFFFSAIWTILFSPVQAQLRYNVPLPLF